MVLLHFLNAFPFQNVACLFTLTLSHTHIYQAIDLLDEAGAVVHMEIPYDASGKMISSGANLPQVTEHTVADVVSQWSNVPIGKIESEETDRLMVLESELTQRVKGQARAVRSVSRAVRRARSGLRDQSRPIASFMFCGPTVCPCRLDWFECSTIFFCAVIIFELILLMHFSLHNNP